MEVVQKLPGLRTLALFIDGSPKDRTDFSSVELQDLPQYIQRLTTLPLTQVKVAIKLHGRPTKTADGICKMLLDPNGASIYAEAQQLKEPGPDKGIGG